MHILFIYPSMGIKENYRTKKTSRKLQSWAMEPLTIATLNGLTPKEHNCSFFDDRIEEIDFNYNCDLVAISVETFTAKRSYEIADKFRKNGKKVVMGGFHPTLCPAEAKEHADAIVIGEAEGIWGLVLDDFKKGILKSFYQNDHRSSLVGLKPDRTIFKGKKYFPISMIETGRGCKFNCDFCAVTLFYKGEFVRRPIEEIVSEVKEMKHKTIMFVDDNICADIKSAKELFKALIPLKIRWASQASINITKDEELLDLMKKSGCLGLLIGFESLNKKNLVAMGKHQNVTQDYDQAISKIYKKGIKLYGSFVIGYDADDKETLVKTLQYSIKKKFFIANFYQLTPFPGTRLYKRLEQEDRLLYKQWWLGDNNYIYGKLVFKPKSMSADELAEMCYWGRKKFYSYKSIFLRSTYNSSGLKPALLYFAVNYLTRKEIHQKQWRKLGRE